jgi:nucleoredoxin
MSNLEENPEQQNQNEEIPPEEEKKPEIKFINPNSYIDVQDNIISILGSNFVDNKNEKIENLSDEIFSVTLIGIFFSASWASPAKIFSKDLIKLYNQMNEGEKIFEIIEVSFDRNENDFKNHISQFPWKFIPFGDNKINELKEKYNVKVVPKFFPIDKEGVILSDEGREDLIKYGVSVLEHWNNEIKTVSEEEVEKQRDEIKRLIQLQKEKEREEAMDD